MKKLITVVLSALIFCLLFVGCVDQTGNTETSDKENPITVYDDEFISVDFVKIVDSIVSGNFELYIKAQNKTDKAVTVYLQDVSINGSMVQVGSGVPCDIIAGANRTHGFFGRLDLAGVSSAAEVEKITFKICLADADFNTIVTTADIEVLNK